MLVQPGPEAAATPREYLRSLYAGSDIVVPDWLLARRPANTHEWKVFGEFLPALALPVFRRLVYTTPDRLVACARSGIPLGTAVLAISQAFKVPIPAADQQVHDYKISMSPTDKVQLNHIGPLVRQARMSTAPAVPRIAIMDGVTNSGDTYRRAQEICTKLGGVCLDWMALTSPTSTDITETPYIAWPNNTSSTAMVAWEDVSHILGVQYTDELEVIRLADTASSKAFREAQFVGAEALASILSADDATYWTGTQAS